MKKLILTVLLVLLALPLTAQVTLFDDDLESGLGTMWTLVASLPASATWELSTTRSHSPSTSLYHADEIGGPYDDWAIFGPITLPAFLADLELTYWDYTYYTSFYTYHGVYISTTDPTASPVTIMTEVSEMADIEADWVERTLDLTAFASAGDDIWVAFRYNEGWDTQWNIDDVLLTCAEPPGYVVGNVNKVGMADNGGASISTFGDGFTTTSTSPSGDYVLPVTPGTYTGVYCTEPGWTSDSNAVSFTLASDDTHYVDFEIEMAPFVNIVGHADLVPTPGADAGIDVYASTGGSDVTAADGSFEIPTANAGHIVVYAEMAGYNVASSMPFDAEPGDTVDVDTLFLNQAEALVCVDFEGDDGGLVGTGSWEWGTPTLVDGPPAAHSPVNCWGTDLDADYGISLSDWTLTMDLTTITASFAALDSITFWHWYYSENGYDGGVVDYSTDGGATWTRVEPTPGYDDDISTSFSSPIAGEWAYTGSVLDWVNAVIDLTATPGLTHLRWRFCSDSSVNSYPGWYIDDVCVMGALLDPVPHPVGDLDGYVYDDLDYIPIEGAAVTCGGVTVYSDEDGYFSFEDILIGLVPVTSHMVGYFPGEVTAAVNEYELTTVYIPMSPIDWAPGGDAGVDVSIAYDHEDSAEVISFCNPTDNVITYVFGPWGSEFFGTTLLRDIDADATPVAIDKPIIADEYAKDNSRNMHTSSVSRATAMGDVIETIDIVGAGLDTPWGLGLIGLWETDYYWLTDIGGTCYIREYERYGSETGHYFDALDFWPSITWVGDMAWDGDGLWLLQVGGTNAMYKVDPATFEVVDSIFDPTPVSGWGSISQRGLAYDHVEDVFYIGGWNSDVIWKIKGKTWDVPGEEIDGGIPALNCAGVAFHPSRRTVWYAANAPLNQIFEVHYETGTVLNTIDVPAAAAYSLAGMEIDGDGKIWYVDMNGPTVYILDSGYGVLPGGIYFDPTNGTLAPGECVTIYLRTAGHSAAAGIYDMEGYLEVDPQTGPITIPLTVNVSPTIDYGWNIVSVPVMPVPNDPWAQLHDDIDPFDASGTGSEIYEWDPVDGRFIVPSRFERGVGYYLWGWHNDTKFDVYGDEYTGDVTTNLTYSHDAAQPGWQVVGNPLNRRIDWDDVVADPGFNGIDPTVWYYSFNTGWATYTPGFAGGFSNQIDPWTGWWVRLRGETASIPFKEDYAYESMAKKNIDKVEFQKKNTEESLSDIVLRISAYARVGGEERFDMWNYMATNADAIDGAPLDSYDHAEMTITPPGGSVLKASFIQGSNRLKDEFKSTFTSGETKTWTMNVTDLNVGDRVTLAWPMATPESDGDGSMGMRTLGLNYDFMLEHPYTGEMIDMREDTTITFIYNGSMNINFIVTANILNVDTEGNTVPENYALNQNTPNPFNATTSFSVSLKDDCVASVAIYNALGEKVKTIAEGQMDAGTYNYTWYGDNDNGDAVSTGIYLYKVETEDFSATKTMILMK